MSGRLAWMLLALLGLPACLDPIVGSECAKGYSPCRGACVVAGSCVTGDAADEAGSGLDAGSEANASEAAATLDAATLESHGEAGAPDEANPRDVEQTETSLPVDAEIGGKAPASDDARAPDDALAFDDGPAFGDARALDDAPPGPIAAIDAAPGDEDASDDGAGVDIQPCADCVDGDDGAESGAAASDDGGVGGQDATGDATGDDASLVCGELQSICNDQCVDLAADPENCGDCNILCSSGVCIDGGCLVCTGEGESVCGRQCVNTAGDPDNCGACGNPCMSGLCSSGQCEAAGTGRAIVIGHDYLKNRPAMNRILGNAVFLWPVNPVRLLVYEGAANVTAIAGADAAIAQVASATGRQLARVAAAAADVTTLLAATDVFLIYGQEQADDTTLGQLGQDWASALFTFVSSGGTVVLLDGVYPGNGGTSQILAQAGLFQIARDVSATGHPCTVVARGDALATGLPKTYLCEKNSTSFVVTPATTVTPVVQDAERVVVVHKIF